MPSVASKPVGGHGVVLTALLRGLATGLGAKTVLSILPTLLRRQLPTAAQGSNTARFAIFMALWCGGSRAALASGAHARPGAVRLVGGAIAALSLAIAEPSDRHFMALWVGARGLATAVRLAAARGIIPTLKAPALLVMMFIASVLMYSLLYHPGNGGHVVCVPRFRCA